MLVLTRQTGQTIVADLVVAKIEHPQLAKREQASPQGQSPLAAR